MGFLVGLPIRRSIWPSAGEFLDRSNNNNNNNNNKACGLILWLKVHGLFFPLNQGGYLPSPSSSPPPPPPPPPSPSNSYNSLSNAPNGPGIRMEQQEETLHIQVSTTIMPCEFYFYRIFMDRANSHTKSFNIPRSFEAIYLSIKIRT